MVVRSKLLQLDFIHTNSIILHLDQAAGCGFLVLYFAINEKQESK